MLTQKKKITFSWFDDDDVNDVVELIVFRSTISTTVI